MAEPFAKPSKKQMKKALKLYSDSLIYWAVNTTIKTLNEMQGKTNEFQIWKLWRKYSRLMFLNFPAILVHNELYEIYSEWAEKRFEIPEIKEKYENMISKEWKSG